MLELAKRMSRAKPSAIMAVAEKAKQLKAQGRDVISFSIGVPNFLPGQHVYDAAAAALETDSGQYGSNRGPDALLDAFIEHMRQIGLTGYERRNCVTGDGAKRDRRAERGQHPLPPPGREHDADRGRDDGQCEEDDRREVPVLRERTFEVDPGDQDREQHRADDHAQAETPFRAALGRGLLRVFRRHSS